MKKIITYKFFTPKENRKVAIARSAGIGENRTMEWSEIYPGEVLMAHQSHFEVLKSHGLIKTAQGQTIYRTQKAALAAKNNTRIKLTE